MQPGAPDRESGRSNVWLVALLAALAPPLWFVFALEASAWPISVIAMPTSALLWFFVARHLATMRSPGKRLLVALGAGLLSPPLGVLLLTLNPCCISAWAIPGLFQHMWHEPLVYFPFGAAMGLVAFAIVRAPAPTAATASS